MDGQNINIKKLKIPAMVFRNFNILHCDKQK